MRHSKAFGSGATEKKKEKEERKKKGLSEDAR